jgi:signal peptidase II
MRWLWVAVLVVVLDRLTKVLAVTHLDVHVPVPLLPSLNLTLTYNTGAAFSLLAGAGGWQRWLFAGLAVAVSGLILWWLRRTSQAWTAVALNLLLGGALGNLWDRLWLGRVVDFVDVYYGSWHWPAFNVADSAITVGAVMLVLESLRSGRA